jgi:hypothetical protein
LELTLQYHLLQIYADLAQNHTPSCTEAVDSRGRSEIFAFELPYAVIPLSSGIIFRHDRINDTLTKTANSHSTPTHMSTVFAQRIVYRRRLGIVR